jgi:Tfp pilus assembly PilM family ATPase
VLDGIKKLAGLSAFSLLKSKEMPIAIDFGAAAMKVLQVGGSCPPTPENNLGHPVVPPVLDKDRKPVSEPPHLIAAACLETPDNLLGDAMRRLDFQFEHLARLVREGGFRGRRVVCSIPSAQTFCKTLQLTKAEGLSVPEMVASAIPEHFGCDPSALVYRLIDVTVPGAPSNRMEVICIGVGREFVDTMMRRLKAAKLEPVGLQSQFAATMRVMDGLRKRQGDEALTSLYLDIGASTTKLMIAHGTKLAFARTIDIGGRHLDETVARQLTISLKEARQERVEAERRAEDIAGADEKRAPVTIGAGASGEGEGEGRVKLGLDERRARESKITMLASLMACPDGASLAEPLEMFADEIAMCLRYHESLFPGRKVDGLVFTGGEARHRGLCQHLARFLRMPAQIADPIARVARTGKEPTTGVDFNIPQPGWVVPLGLCFSPTDL